MPGALLVVLAGLMVAVIQYPSVLRTLRFGPSMPQILWPTWEEWKKGAAPSPRLLDSCRKDTEEGIVGYGSTCTWTLSVYPSPARSDNGSPATGIILTGIPQLPVTTLNSVVAVCQLSADLFPARPAQPVLVSVSVGLMNVVGAWFGAMPCCHGAGGLAAQV